MGKKLVVYKLRSYLKKLYEGYPSHFYYGYEKEKEMEGIEDGIKHLIEDGIIKEQEFTSGYTEGETPAYKMKMLTPIMSKRYRLTSEGLKLVDGWYIERLTHGIIALSMLTLLLSIIQTLISLRI